MLDATDKVMLDASPDIRYIMKMMMINNSHVLS